MGATDARHGTINADGFGIGWYASGDPVPARYRRAFPIWSDPSIPDLARVTTVGRRARRGALRDGGHRLGEAAAAPFASGSWLFSHNGVLAGWPRQRRRWPSAGRRLLTLEALTDSALLWALWWIACAPGRHRASPSP